MASRLPLVFVLALGSGGLVSCLAGSDDDEASPNNAGSGGAAAGSSGTGGATGGSGGATGGSAGSGTGGAMTGGTSGSGTGGRDGTGGSTAGVGGMACCLAFPTCGEGEVEVPSLDDCPAGAICHEVSICCSTIVCADSGVQCNAIPVCDAGDEEVKSCPASSVCYSRTLCGTTITCDDGPSGTGGTSGSGGSGGSGGVPASCDPALEHDRDYVADSPAECAVIFYACPDHTEAFSNDCGCGCEQSADCPEFVDCMPGPDPRPGCTADERARCPYTDVAF